jgi:hypothetical protein
VSALRPFDPMPLALEEISLSSKPLDYHFGSGKLDLQSSRCLADREPHGINKVYKGPAGLNLKWGYLERDGRIMVGCRRMILLCH